MLKQIREWEGNEKNPFPQFGNGKGMKITIPITREREGNEEKNIPKIREREGNEKIHSHNSGMGIRGYHSQEFPGTRTGMKKKHDNKRKIFREVVT